MEGWSRFGPSTVFTKKRGASSGCADADADASSDGTKVRSVRTLSEVIPGGRRPEFLRGCLTNSLQF
jgi:hypothetical protein